MTLALVVRLIYNIVGGDTMSVYNEKHKDYTKKYVKDKYSRVSAYFQIEDKQRLDDYCADHDITVSSFIKSVVLSTLKRAGY